jgi:hypothetical protein
MCATPMGEKEGHGNNCDDCAEKNCKAVIACRAKLRAARLNIVVSAPLFSQLGPENATCLKKSVLSTLNGDLILIDTEAHHRSHQFSDTYELAAFKTSDHQEFYSNRTDTSLDMWNVWIGKSLNGKMDYSVEKKRCSVPDMLKLFNGFVGILPIGYYTSANAVDYNRLKGLYSAGAVDINQQRFLNIGFEVTFRLFGPYGMVKTPDLCQATIHNYMFKASDVIVPIPGSIALKKSRKVFDYVVMLFNIWNALIKDTVVVTDEEVELKDDLDVVDEIDDELFE